MILDILGFVSCESDSDSVDQNKVKIISWDVSQSELATESEQQSAEMIVEDDLPKVTHESVLNDDPIMVKKD